MRVVQKMWDKNELYLQTNLTHFLWILPYCACSTPKAVISSVSVTAC